MRKIIACILAFSLILTCAGCSFGKENQGSESASSSQASSDIRETSAVPSAAAETQGSSQVPAETQASVSETEGTIVEITLPAEYREESTTQEACDAIAEKENYESVTLNDDGSATYVMTVERHQQLLRDTADSIDASLEGLCGSEGYPDLVSVTPNDDYTEFTVLTRSTAIGTEETQLKMNFYLYGGMYQAMAGNPDAVIHVVFRNSDTDEILGESDSAQMQAADGFVDVAADSYYYDAVCWAAEKGIAAGTDSTHFSPDKSCTRAQLLIFLWRIEGEPQPEAAENPYTDIDENTFGFTAILWAAQQGLVSADDGTEFSPNAAVPRSEAMLVLWRYAGYPTPENTESVFEDVESGNDLCSAVMWAVEQGIASGTGETTFDPYADCTRAQVVTFLYRDFGD